MDIAELIKTNPQDYWFSTDLYCAGALALLMGEEPILISHGSMVNFVYRKTDILREALWKYKSDVPLPCRSLLESVKRIRGNLAIQKTLSEKRG